MRDSPIFHHFGVVIDQNMKDECANSSHGNRISTSLLENIEDLEVLEAP